MPNDTIAVLTEKLAKLESEVASLRNHRQIVDVYRRFTRGLNRYDMELLRSVFWPDAQINYGPRSNLRDEWIASWQKRYHKGETGHAHQITNETVDIVGDVAHVESYVVAYYRKSDGQSTMMSGGRYIDRLNFRDGQWRIAVREFLPHFISESKSLFESTYSREKWPCSLGEQDKSDLSYSRPLNPRPNKKDAQSSCGEP